MENEVYERFENILRVKTT
jgi:hypothetical protein